MKLTKDELELLERMGANFFSIEKAAIVLEKEKTALKVALKDKKSEAYQYYYKGLFKSEMELRESIFKLAKRGSNPAQKMALDILNGMRVDND